MKDDNLNTNDDDNKGQACILAPSEVVHNSADRRLLSLQHGRRSVDTVAEKNLDENVENKKLNSIREVNAQLREVLVSSREQEVATKEHLYEVIEDHMIVLQQVNSKLVIATIEATELAEKLKIAKTELEISKNLAEKANHAKSDFLSSMSHELRTPLNAILGFAQLLETSTPAPTEAQTKKLNQITKAGWYLLDLINQILELAVIESGKLSVSQGNVSLKEIILECQVMIEPQALQRNVQLRILPVDPTYTVIADKTRLKQVLFNLLSNAIKYNKNPGTVDLACSISTSGMIRIGIKDSGLGLSAEKLDHLFQPFNRLGQEKGLNQGTGIGLMISKELVELMGGNIGVSSTVGLGTEFWVEFVNASTRQILNVKTVSQKSKSLQQTKSSKHVLLYVEDNPANLMLVEHIIESHPNISILTASDGNMGIALARAHLPDAILLDINLPGISGFETLQILHSDKTTADIPVLAISANALPQERDLALKAGFCCYLTKPIKVNAFMNELYKALAQRK